VEWNKYLAKEAEEEQDKLGRRQLGLIFNYIGLRKYKVIDRHE